MNELVCGLWLGQDCSLAVAALALAVPYFVCKGRVRVVCVEVKRDRGSFVDGVYLSCFICQGRLGGSERVGGVRDE